MGDLQTNNLLSVNQHGFRSGFSCETQLILTVHDLLESFEHLERADSRIRDASRNYKIKSAKTELFKHYFFINTSKIRNKLPSVIKDAQSLESFKIAIRKHYQ